MELVVCMERRPDKFIFTKMFRGREAPGLPAAKQTIAAAQSLQRERR